VATDQRRTAFLVALLPVGVGLALRLAYALHAEPFVDEPTTMLVAEAIARTGVPVLPSGLFYGNDLPFSYLAGALVALFGPHLLAVRLLSVAASIATIALVYSAGRRLFSLQAGLWAGLLLALAPQEIIWGSRARAYALLELLVLASAWLYYTGVSGDRAGPRRLGLLLLVAAIFVHPEAALLLPALVVATGLIKGWRWWAKPVHLAELALAVAGASARYLLQVALARGWIGGYATVAGSRPPLQLPFDLPARLTDVAPFFLDPERLPWTLFALLALAIAVWQISRGKDCSRSQPTLFFSVCLWLPPAAMVLLLGSTYQSPRYLAMLLPIFALVAAAGLDQLVAGLRLYTKRWTGLAVTAGLTLAILAAYAPSAVTAATSPEKGFRQAFELVKEQWQPGDRVATVAPAFSQLVLGRSDLFTLGKEHEEFVYRAADGRLVDRWTGSPLVRTGADLAAALDDGGRLWLVVDESRFRQRFDADFAQMAWQRMELAAKVDGVMVFVSHDALPPVTSRAVDAVFGDQVALLRYDLGLAEPGSESQPVAHPGQSLPFTLYWQATGPVDGQYTVFVHLLDADGQRYAQGDGPPLQGLQPMVHWQPGEILPDRRTIDLPPDLPPGRYHLAIGLYGADGSRLPIRTAAGQPLGDTFIIDGIQVEVKP
jgi:hypothetical protein